MSGVLRCVALRYFVLFCSILFNIIRTTSSLPCYQIYISGSESGRKSGLHISEITGKREGEGEGGEKEKGEGRGRGKRVRSRRLNILFLYPFWLFFFWEERERRGGMGMFVLLKRADTSTCDVSLTSLFVRELRIPRCGLLSLEERETTRFRFQIL